MNHLHLQRSGQLPLRFNGELLAITDSKKADSVRWSEIAIYRADEARFIVHTIGRTTHPNEQDRFTVIVCEGAADVLRALARENGRFTNLALRALSAAAMKDAALTAASTEDLCYQGTSIRDRGSFSELELYVERLHCAHNAARCRYVDARRSADRRALVSSPWYAAHSDLCPQSRSRAARAPCSLQLTSRSPRQSLSARCRRSLSRRTPTDLYASTAFSAIQYTL